MKSNVKKLGRKLNWSELKNVNGSGGSANCYQGNTCTFPISGGQAYGECATNSNSQCVCDAQSGYGQSIVASFCKKS